MKKKTDKTKDKIFDAAEQIVLDGNPSHLSLEAVANKAGLSKGCLTYHFPSKEKLLKALIKRHVHRLSEEREKNAHLFENSMIIDTKVHLRTINKKIKSRTDQLTAAFFNIAVHDLSLLEPVKTYHRKMFDRLKGQNPKWMEIFALRVAVYGLWHMTMLDILPLTDREFQDLATHLIAELDKS
jgi:AcrR family transcriptional regulator